MARTKGKKPASALSRQRPKPRRRKKKVALSPFRIRILSIKRIAGLLILCAVAGGGYLAMPYVSSLWPQKQATRQNNDWRISLNTDGDTSLPDGLVQTIMSTAQSNLGAGSRQELEKAAAEIQKLGSFAQVHFLKLGLKHVVLHLQRRTPILCVKADRLRYLTESGQIYGRVAYREDGSPDCRGPTLTGIFPEGRARKFRLRQNGTLAVSGEEQTLIDEAIALFGLTKQLSQPVIEITHQPFRGFLLQLEASNQESQTSVAVGRRPFAQTIQRLHRILEDLARQKKIAERIELDYQGKAFIKAKKM